MQGPRPAGTWSTHAALPFKLLQCGCRYRVTREFRDYDGAEHVVGEVWTFLGHRFVPYDDGMSFFVSFDGGQQEWLIRLKWDEGHQADVLSFPERHFETV